MDEVIWSTIDKGAKLRPSFFFYLSFLPTYFFAFFLSFFLSLFLSFLLSALFSFFLSFLLSVIKALEDWEKANVVKPEKKPKKEAKEKKKGPPRKV